MYGVFKVADHEYGIDFARLTLEDIHIRRLALNSRFCPKITHQGECIFLNFSLDFVRLLHDHCSAPLTSAYYRSIETRQSETNAPEFGARLCGVVALYSNGCVIHGVLRMGGFISHEAQ